MYLRLVLRWKRILKKKIDLKVTLDYVKKRDKILNDFISFFLEINLYTI
jgi:hypothetical protein